MVPISSLDGNDDDAERPVVSGYVSLPTCYKSTRQHMSFFVNRRWVLSRMLSYAIEEAYHSLLLAGRHPIVVVNIAVDLTQIDVNVHPAKTEIRFLKERRVYAAILRAVRRAALEGAEIPRWGKENVGARFIAPGAQDNNAPTSLSMTPSLDIEGDEEFSVPDPGAINRAPISNVAAPPESIDLDIEENEDDFVGAPGIAPSDDEEPSTFPQDNPWLTVTEEETGTKPPLLSRLWQSHVHSNEDLETNDAYQAPAPGNVVAPLARARGAGARLPPLRVVGQLSQSYIVTEGPDGMYLIDQHAAHERILLERMVAALQARTPLSQLLLTPIKLELSPAELGAIEDHLQQLEHIGFTLEILENNTLEILAVPNVLVKQMNARSLHDLLAELTAPENPGHAETWEEYALANVACKAAIKANYFLTVSEMREMIEQLAQTNAPYSCCHGRPTMIHFSLSTLEREFGRR